MNFKINQDFIAEVLCINKDKPMSTCNGKCYLSKQLKEQEEQEEKQTPRERNERVEVLYCNEITLAYEIVRIGFLNKNESIPKYVAFYSQEFIDDVFQPPQLG